MSSIAHIHIRDGLSQTRRHLPALEKDYFNINEMRFEQLLTQMQTYSQLVKLVGVVHEHDESSHELFADDEIMVMAQILSLDLIKLESLFELQLARNLGDSSWALSETKHYSSPLGFAKLIDTWLLWLRYPQSGAGEELYSLLESVVIGLGKELYTLNAHLPSAKSFGNIFSSYFIDLITKDISKAPPGKPLLKAIDPRQQKTIINLRSIYASLLKAVEMIQDGARRLLPQSLVSQNHDPAASLRIAFAALYQKVQNKANRFTLDYIDFYFQKVLQAQLRPQRPDSLYLVVNLNAQEKEILLPKGTQFLAGLDKNSQDIIYAADESTQLNDAKVVCLHNLFFERSAAISYELNHKWSYSRAHQHSSFACIPEYIRYACGYRVKNSFIFWRARKTQLSLRWKYISDNSKKIFTYSSPQICYYPCGSSYRNSLIYFRESKLQSMADSCMLDTIPVLLDGQKKDRDKMLPYPLFGAHRGDGMSATAMSAQLGFAIASHTLLMREGKRKITIDLQYADLKIPGCSTLKERLGQLPDINENQSSDEAKFFAYFGKMFSLTITTTDGWYQITEYKPSYKDVEPSIKPNCLRISFLLPEDAPAIVAYTADIHGDNFPIAVPLLRFTLRDNFLQYPYDILKQFVLREIRIEVSADGCHELILHNNIGQLSPLSPFAPFGPLPQVGSFFIVGHDEVRAKQLTRFDIDIEWGGLPATNDGFKAWYKGYANPVDTSKYTVSVNVLADGRWWPQVVSSSDTAELFSSRVKPGGVELVAQKKLTCASALAYYKAQDVQQNQKEFNYTTATKAGLFKFTLQGPAGAFGHQEYPLLLSSVLTYNGRVKHESLQKKLPNAPYTPQITSIRLNYSATAVITLADADRQQGSVFRDQFFHLHPLGWEAISPLRHPRVFQVPQYDAAGTLFIGLKASELPQVSLFFHLLNDSLPMDEQIVYGKKAAPVSWFYLSDNQWRPLQPKNILADSTNYFMTSGIVTVNLEGDINTNNTIMPAGIFWLKITANTELKKFSHIYSVYAQAVKATWQSGEHPPSIQPMVLAADTIKRTRQTIPGITGVQQICASFGGMPGETVEHLRMRVSERLRHKNRALTPMDYEMLILEAFPEIFKVKCFANVSTDSQHKLSPGHVLIVPVPYLNENSPSHYKPHFDGHLILAIKEFVQQIAPAFVSITVENPVYEEVQVRCAVHLKKGHHVGHHHNLLNKALCDYISPWSPVGNSVHFGWNIGEQEIKSFIQNLDYVEQVTDFSLLRIAPQKEGFFVLNDTAATKELSDKLRPSYLWSVAVPIANHYIQTIDNNAQITAEITGYDELEVGSTFIIS